MAGSAGLWSCHHRRKRLLRASKLQVTSERRHRSLGVLVSAVRCTASLAGSGSADGQHAVRADLGVGDLVRDDRVVPRFGGDQLDEAALRGCQVEHLGAAMIGVARPQQVRAFLEHRVELRAHYMEGAGPLRTGVQHPDPHPLSGLGSQRDRVVLPNVAVEDHGVGGASAQLGVVGGAVRRTQVELRLNQRELPIHRREPRRVDDDSAVHAVGDVVEHRRGPAVVHPGAGEARGEPVDQRLAGLDGPHRLVRGDRAGVEVDAVAHRAVVDQSDHERVADPAVQRRPRHGAAEGPHPLPHVRRHLDVLIDHGQRHGVLGASGCRRQDRVVRREAAARRGLGVDGGVRGAASRRVCGPSATLRSCRPRSRLVTSRTRFVPAGTSMERGSIVMSPSDTATTWVAPAAREVLAPPATAPWPRSPTAIAAPSSTMARPTAPATTTARRPEPGPVPAGAEAVGAGGGGGVSAVTNRLAASSTKAPSAATTSVHPSAVSQDGPDTARPSTPRLTATMRGSHACSSVAVACRAPAGPRPSTTGSRKVSAPVSTWPTKPTSSTGTNRSSGTATAATSGARSMITTSATTATASQVVPAASSQVAAVCGCRWTAVRTSGIIAVTSPAAYSTNPAAAPRVEPANSAAMVAVRPTTVSASVRWAASLVPSTMRVRSAVGQSVNSVPSTVRATQPSTLVCTWAACSRPSQTPRAWPVASSVPNTMPASRKTPAAT